MLLCSYNLFFPSLLSILIFSKKKTHTPLLFPSPIHLYVSSQLQPSSENPPTSSVNLHSPSTVDNLLHNFSHLLSTHRQILFPTPMMSAELRFSTSCRPCLSLHVRKPNKVFSFKILMSQIELNEKD